MTKLVLTISSLILSFVYLIVLVQSQITPKVVLYENTNSTGTNVSIGAIDVSELSRYSFDNLARSTCVTGTWLFYDSIFWNAFGNAGIEYIFGNEYCVNFIGLGGAVSSMRFAGSAIDYRASTLTLYIHTYFQGTEEFTVEDLPSLSLAGRISSLIVTGGPSEAWTFYDQTNYVGSAICIYPPFGSIFEPAFIYDTTIISMPLNTIRSVRKGCHGKVIPVLSARQGFHAFQNGTQEEA